MSFRRVVFVSLPLALAACAGVAFAVPHAQNHVAKRPVATATPAPTATPQARPVEQTSGLPSNGHHVVSGPEPVVERHVIHTTGSVGVTSGTVAGGSSQHGAIGTPKPKP